MSEDLKNIVVLVTGASGQLGQAIRKESERFTEIKFVFTTKDELDITSLDAIHGVLKEFQPDVLINTAAYTAVDLAEEQEDLAYLLNEEGPRNLAICCNAHHVKLVHVSTDYIFGGDVSSPYKETNQVNPQTVYGASKLAGEQAITKESGLIYCIVRTSWLYSLYSNNFCKTMLRLGAERDEISVVDDQVGCPTLANDLAVALITIARRLDKQSGGVYHFCNEGSVSWYAFAKAIFHHSKTSVILHPVTTDQYPTVAKRPKYSVLDTEKIRKTFGVVVNPWETSLKVMLRDI